MSLATGRNALKNLYHRGSEAAGLVRYHGVRSLPPIEESLAVCDRRIRNQRCATSLSTRGCHTAMTSKPGTLIGDLISVSRSLCPRNSRAGTRAIRSSICSSSGNEQKARNGVAHGASPSDTSERLVRRTLERSASRRDQHMIVRAKGLERDGAAFRERVFRPNGRDVALAVKEPRGQISSEGDDGRRAGCVRVSDPRRAGA